MTRPILFLIAGALLLAALYLTGAVSLPVQSDTPPENRSRAATADATVDADILTAAASDSTAGLMAARLPERSLYHLTSTWMNQHSKQVAWSSFQGRPILVAMFYTHCGFTCPRIVHDLKGILSELPRNERRTVGIVLVSIDPEHDTPEALKAFSKMHGLERPQWNLLTGRDQDVRELAAVLGVRYRKQSGDDFAHSNTITLLDPMGEIITQRDDLSTGGEPFVTELQTWTSRGVHHPTESNLEVYTP